MASFVIMVSVIYGLALINFRPYSKHRLNYAD